MAFAVSYPKEKSNRQEPYYWGIVFGLIGILILGIARLVDWLNPPFPKCFFKSITGIPCVSCGTTRTILEISKLHFKEAFFHNPLIFILGVGVGCYAIYSLGIILLKFPRINWSWAKPRLLFIRILIIFVIILNWIYLIITHQ